MNSTMIASGLMVFTATAAVAQNPSSPAPPFTVQTPTYTTGETSVAELPLSTVAGTLVPPNLTLQAQAQMRLATALSESTEGQALGAKPIADGNLEGCDPNAEAFDWRTKKILSPVKDQGQCGDCFIFASTGAFEASWFLQNKQQITVSEQQIMDCAKAGECQGGWHGDILNFLKQKGVTSDTDAGFAYSGKASGSCHTAQPLFNAVSWSYIDGSGTMASVSAIKKALCGHGPVISAVYATPAFQKYTGGVFNEFAEGNGESSINHDVLIAGWDNTKDAWLIKNSWGATKWGDQGYMWMRYRSNYIGFGAAWVDAAKVSVLVSGIENIKTRIVNLNRGIAETVAKQFKSISKVPSSSVLHSLGFLSSGLNCAGCDLPLILDTWVFTILSTRPVQVESKNQGL